MSHISLSHSYDHTCLFNSESTIMVGQDSITWLPMSLTFLWMEHCSSSPKCFNQASMCSSVGSWIFVLRAFGILVPLTTSYIKAISPGREVATGHVATLCGANSAGVGPQTTWFLVSAHVYAQYIVKVGSSIVSWLTVLTLHSTDGLNYNTVISWHTQMNER